MSQIPETGLRPIDRRVPQLLDAIHRNEPDTGNGIETDHAYRRGTTTRLDAHRNEPDTGNGIETLLAHKLTLLGLRQSE